MSIRLLYPIFLAGVLSPVDGSTLTLPAALEADLVNQGKAEWVKETALAADSGNDVISVINNSTGLFAGFRRRSKNRTYGQVGALFGDAFASICLLLNKSGGVEVLPTDYSQNAVVCTFGANSAAPWANAGYYSSEAAVDASLHIPNAAINVNLFADSFIVAVTVNAPTVSQGLMGTIGASSATKPNFSVQLDASGNVGFRVRVNASNPFAGTYTSAALTGGADHRLLFAWDAPTKKLYSYVDGTATNLSPQTATTVLDTDIITDDFALGKVQTANAYAAKFAGFQMFKFLSSGLPLNLTELVTNDNLHRRSGLMGQPCFT